MTEQVHIGKAGEALRLQTLGVEGGLQTVFISELSGM